MINIAKTLRAASHIFLLRNAVTVPKNCTQYSSITTWNKDWKPGPYPRTEEERLAAAKKYYLLPEDYEPYPEEEGYGDYPKFEATHMENRDDFQVYDFPVLKRNFGEPVHPDFDICLEDKVNFQKKYKTPMWKQFLYVITVGVIYSSIIIYEELNPSDNHLIPKQFPHRGGKSYTFEPAD